MREVMCYNISSQDVVLMYCQWFSIQHAVIFSPFPPIFYLLNHPHPPPAGVKITPGVNIPRGPVLYRGVACKVACAVCTWHLFFSGLKEYQAIKDIILMYFGGVSVVNAINDHQPSSTNPSPTAPASSNCGRRNIFLVSTHVWQPCFV